jgi:archaellum component FlaC
MSMLTERCLEKIGKKLIERTDVEDALKRLDTLTQEEARMAVAQNLKATHTVDERVRGVADMVVAIDNRVAGVGDRVAGIDDRLARVDDRVARVDDRVARVGDRMALVDDKVASVDDKVASVDDKVASIDNKVKSIDSRMASVDDRVVIVDDKVAAVIQGTQIVFSQACDLFNLNRSDGREANQVIKQTANDVDLVKRASSPNISLLRPTVSCR